MTALERVREYAKQLGLAGEVRKEYHKMLRGYWLFSDPDVYLGNNEEVACHMIFAIKYGKKEE